MGTQPNDWNTLGAERLIAPLACRLHRVAESQETVATLMLVDNRDEQQVLEELLEGSKPPLAADLRDLHYLLAAPFRYPWLTRQAMCHLSRLYRERFPWLPQRSPPKARSSFPRKSVPATV